MHQPIKHSKTIFERISHLTGRAHRLEPALKCKSRDEAGVPASLMPSKDPFDFLTTPVIGIGIGSRAEPSFTLGTIKRDIFP